MIKDVFKNIWSKMEEIIEKNAIISVIIVLIVVIALATSIYAKGDMTLLGNIFSFQAKGLTAQVAGQKAIDFINNNILKGTGTVSLKETQEVSGMYKFKITFVEQNQDTDIYLTRDGRYLFPVMEGIPIDLDEKIDGGTDTSKITSCEQIEKADAPVLQAFVVSQCPFGLQMQRILAKAIEQGVSADNIIIRYIGSVADGKITSMHGDAEAQENLKQICIREEQASKYWSYVSCYMKKGETDSCLTSTGVNKTSLNACVSDSSKGLVYAQEDFSISDQYGVGGSPTLIINGLLIEEFDASTNECLWTTGCRTADAEKSIICCASNNEAGVCSQTLSKDPAASGFSETYTSGSDSDGGASCGT